MELERAKVIVLEVARAIADTIDSAGEIPEGHLYAALMDKVSIENFNLLVDLLVRSGRITRSNHLLRSRKT